jgi:hypothetical protein
LRARITIIVLRVQRAFSRRLRQRAVLLEWEKSLCQLDHVSPKVRVFRTRQPFLPAVCAALVGGASRQGQPAARQSHMAHDSTSSMSIVLMPTRCTRTSVSFMGHALQMLKASVIDLRDRIDDQPMALRRSSADVSGCIGRPSGARNSSRCSGLVQLVMTRRTPRRRNAAFMRLIIRGCSAMKLSRPRLGRLASSMQPASKPSAPRCGLNSRVATVSRSRHERSEDQGGLSATAAVVHPVGPRNFAVSAQGTLHLWLR